MLQFTGFTVLAPQVVYSVARQMEEERAAELAAWATRVVGLADEDSFEVGTY